MFKSIINKFYGKPEAVKKKNPDKIHTKNLYDFSMDNQTVFAVPHENNAYAHEVLDIKPEDMLAEADVYWTYGKFHDALAIYQWWITTRGSGQPYFLDNAVQQELIASRLVDCAIQAQDFSLCADILVTLESGCYPKKFLGEQGLIALRHDPGNFFLIEFCNKYIDDASIEKIVKKESIRNESAADKKAKLWKKNRTDANKIAITDGKQKVSRIDWNFSNRGIDLLTCALKEMNDDDALRYANIAFMDIVMTEEEFKIIGNMAGTGLLENDSGGLCPELNYQIYHSVFEAMRIEASSKPTNIGIQVEMLRVLHDECDLKNYVQWLFHLSVVLFSFNGGESLKRRLIAIGKLLGPHPLWDRLSVSLDYDKIKKISQEYGFDLPRGIELKILPNIPLVLETETSESMKNPS